MFVRRFDFFIWRLRHIVMLISIYFVWATIYSTSARFGTYTRDEIMTYIFLGGGVFEAFSAAGYSLFEVGAFINRGELSSFLLKPISFLRFQMAKDSANKILVICSSLIELLIFVNIFSIDLVIQKDFWLILLTVLAIVLAMVLSFYLNFLINAMAFWTREADGPRFLFYIFKQFASGTFFPLNVLPKVLFQIFASLPFSFMVYFPIQIYLGKLNVQEIGQGFVLGAVWVVGVVLLASYVWNLGLKKYQAEGG